MMAWLIIVGLFGGMFAMRVGWLLIQEARRRRTEKISYGP